MRTFAETSTQARGRIRAKTSGHARRRLQGGDASPASRRGGACVVRQSRESGTLCKFLLGCLSSGSECSHSTMKRAAPPQTEVHIEVTRRRSPAPTDADVRARMEECVLHAHPEVAAAVRALVEQALQRRRNENQFFGDQDMEAARSAGVKLGDWHKLHACAELLLRLCETWPDEASLRCVWAHLNYAWTGVDGWAP